MTWADELRRGRFSEEQIRDIHASIAFAGYAVVPLEPTEAMIEAGRKAQHAALGYPTRDLTKDAKAVAPILRAGNAAAQEGRE